MINKQISPNNIIFHFYENSKTNMKPPGNKMKQIAREIKKRRNVIIRIGKGSMGGYDFGEIRQYSSEEDGIMKPTPKGITFSPEHIDEIIAGFTDLKRLFISDPKG